MTITDLSPREQAAIDWAYVRYTWPGRDSNEGLVINTKYQVEQFAQQMDKEAFEKTYSEFKSLPPDQQENITKILDATSGAPGGKPASE